MIENISQEKLNSNWERFKELLLSTQREGVDELIDYLENKTDFKTAPASTKYHGAFQGGLCAHSLSVYDTLVRLVDNVLPQDISINSESLIITALLHDISKVNTYETTYFNKKVYSSTGSKFDENGKFDWVSEKGYKMREDRFIFVNHESTSEFIARQFINLSIKESTAIMTHHNGLGYDSIPTDAVAKVYGENNLAILLHMADLMAAYMIC